MDSTAGEAASDARVRTTAVCTAVEGTTEQGGMPRPEEHTLRRDGDTWTIHFGGRTIRIRDSNGLRYLAVLLRRPGEAIHVVDLRAMAGRAASAGRRCRAPVQVVEPARVAVTKGIKRAIEVIATHHPALAAHLEATVRRGYLCRYTPDPRHPIEWTE
jgi:hypothetical protein